MRQYLRTRFHMEFDLDLQMPPGDATLKQMVREAVDGIIRNRYCKVRNLRIASRNKIIDKESVSGKD